MGSTKGCRNNVDQLSSKQEWKLQPGYRVAHGFELFVKEKPNRTIPATASVSKFVIKRPKSGAENCQQDGSSKGSRSLVDLEIYRISEAKMQIQVMNSPKKRTNLSNAAGVTLVELLVVMTMIAIVATFALFNFQKSNRGFNLAGAARTFSTYLEQARLDAIRRHNNNASVVLNSNSSYTVNVDVDGTGTTTARTITLPAGTSLSYKLPPATADIDPSTTPITISYDWRGLTANTVSVTFTDSTSGVRPSTVVAGISGDNSTDTSVTGPVTTPTPQVAVSPTSGSKNMNGN
jgi:prepilin-type N-terminal cleavage/methylation domain-containing protein